MPKTEAVVRLTWPQVIWALAVLATLLAAWFDLRSQVTVQSSAILGLERRMTVLENAAAEHWRSSSAHGRSR